MKVTSLALSMYRDAFSQIDLSSSSCISLLTPSQFTAVAHLFLYPTIFEEIVPSLPPLAHTQITGFTNELKPVIFELDNSEDEDEEEEEEEEEEERDKNDVKVQCEYDNWIDHPLTCINEGTKRKRRWCCRELSSFL
jgi:hypothetical protein